MIRTIFPMTTENEKNLPFIVKGIGVQENQEHISRPSGLTDYQWAHCMTGEGILIIAGRKYIINNDMGFFFHPNIPHEYYATKEPWKIAWLIFNGSAIRGLLTSLELRQWEVMKLHDTKAIDKSLKAIYLSLISDKPDRALDSSALLYKFLVKLKDFTCSNNENQNKKHRQLLPIISYMEKNYAKSISLEEMANIIHITPYHLCRIFKKTYHLTPFQYLTRLRIQKAKELLIEFPTMPVKTIALKVGYRDVSYFCSIFKKNEGNTPLDFRKIHGII